MRAALDAFFQGFGFTEADALSRLAAWALPASPEPLEPAQALARAQAQVEAWLARALGAQAGEAPLLSRGRLAFLACDGARRWPHLFGAPALPEAVREELRGALPVPLPPQAPCAMPEQQLVLWPWLETLRRWWRASQADVPVP